MKRRILTTLVLLFALASCTTQKTADNPFGIDANTVEGGALAKWFDGEEETANEIARTAGDSATALFSKAEIAHSAGDIEFAFEHWTEMLQKHPAHPLSRTVAARLYSARDEIVDFEDRVWPLFPKLDYASFATLTRVYVSLIHQTVGFRRWRRSNLPVPFSGASLGFPAAWLTTPNLSPWRLRDFDEKFAPETSLQLATRYLSPQTATDVEVNYEDVEPYWTSGITLYPSFANSGVHYLETYATVRGTGTRDYMLYGNFVGATKVWIDGELVLERREDDYGTGKRLRRIKLEPGHHRVLVKMAYQSGYRDWFDLVFVPLGSAATDQSELDFAYACLPHRELPGCIDAPQSTGGLTLATKMMRPADLEQILVEPDQAAKATDIGLWVTMINAYYDGEHDHFAAAWKELQERRPQFAAGWDLWADEVQTQWQVPSKLRDARALQAVRKAYELYPESLAYQTRLGSWLTRQGEKREARKLLETARENARDGDRLRSFTPLTTWASYLDSENWDTHAEQAWGEVLAADPANCKAARELQRLLYARSDYRRPEEITERQAACPELREAWTRLSETYIRERIEIARRDAGRSPLRGDYARNLARLLWQSGADDEAKEVLENALKVNPHSAAIAAELADRAYATGDTATALKILDRYQARYGNSAWLVWKRARMTGDIPLTDIMPDGRAAANDAVARGQTQSLSNDEAYFVVDFAARRYFPDGSKLTLTHTVVRVMTKGAIDRYGEQSLPGNARPLLVRTIKQDGSVRVPEETAGKSVLSMPGLAEGDFVEIAYLEYDGPSTPAHHIEGVRFFFRMSNISTLHSEYVVIGDIADFIRENDAPQIEEFTYNGMPAVRFLATNNPRPRSEPRTVSAEEYLPWVQMYRHGSTIDDVEKFRRGIAESVADSSKTSNAFEAQLNLWTQGELGEPGSEAWLKEIFYRVSGFISDPTISPRSFNTDVNHAVLLKDGNTMLILKTVLDRFKVPSEIFAVKSKYQIPREYPIREENKYSSVLLRVTSPQTGEHYWLNPDGPDAMFNAVSPALAGQPAICTTCAQSEETTIATSDVREANQRIDAKAKLDAQGNLTGTLTFTFDGQTAAGVRGGLRGRTDETSRVKFVDALASNTFAGSAATAYDIRGELQPDEPLVIVVNFKRDGFAREVSPGEFQVEDRLFRDGVASAFGGLSERTTPMMVGFSIDNDYSLTLDLSDWKSAELVSPSGERKFDSPFGTARRTTQIADGTLSVVASTDLPIQRVSTSDYQAFQRWALAVEQSSVLLFRLRN